MKDIAAAKGHKANSHHLDSDGNNDPNGGR